MGLSQEFLKKGAGILLGASGLLFLTPSLQENLTNLLSRWTQGIGHQSKKNKDVNSLYQEFFSGLLLGLIWSPCSGPSLGVALGLATQAGGIGPAATLLAAFGTGAVIPILIFAYGAKGLTKKIRIQGSKIMWVKKIIGLSMFVFGILIFTSLDKGLESFLNRLLPESYVQFTNKF